MRMCLDTVLNRRVRRQVGIDTVSSFPSTVMHLSRVLLYSRLFVCLDNPLFFLEPLVTREHDSVACIVLRVAHRILF